MGARRIAMLSAGGVVALAVLLATALGGVYLFVGSDAGRDAVARLAERVADDNGIGLRIGAIDGDLLSGFTLRDVRLADRGGAFGSADRIAVDWRPIALLRRAVDIERIAVGRLALDRLPVVPEPPGSDNSTAGPAIDIRLGALAVETLALGAPVLGTAQQFAASASLELARDGTRAKAVAALRPVGGADDAVQLTLDYAARPARFALKGRVREPQGGLVGRLAGLAPGTPLSVEIDGTGPPTAWRGTLAGTAGGIARVDARMSAAVGDAGLAATIAGTAAVAQALRPELRPLAARDIAFDAALDIRPGRAVVLRSFTARSDGGRIVASGKLGLADGALTGAVTADLGAGAALSSLIAPASIASAKATARLGGRLAAPTVDAGIEAAGFAIGPVRAGALRGTATLGAPGEAGRAATLRLTLDGVAADGVPAGLLGPTAALTGEATIRDGGALPRLVATLRTGSVALDLDGALAADGTARASWTASLADVAPLAAMAGTSASGSLALRGAGTFDLAAGTGRTTLDGAVSALNTPDAALRGLLGPRVPFSLAATLGAGGIVEIGALRLQPAAGAVAATGRLDTVKRTLDARLTADLAKLERFSAVAGVPLAGTARLTATVSGPLARPGIQAAVRAAALSVNGVALGALGLDATGRPAPGGFGGSVRLRGAVAGRALTAETALSLADGTLDLTDMRIALGRDSATGAMRVGLARSSVDGALTATVADLGTVASLAGARLAGRATLRASFEDGGAAAGQGVVLDIDARDLAGDGAAADSAVVSLRLDDALGKLRFAASATLRNVRAADARMSAVALTSAGRPDAASWTARADGAWRGALALDAAGDIARAEQAVSVSVTRLSGTVAGQPVRLRESARIRIGAGTIEAAPVALDLAGGRLDGEGRWSGPAVGVALTAARIPARLLAVAVPRIDLDGAVSARLRIRGAPARPDIDATVELADMRPPGLADDGAVRFHGKATLTQRAAKTTFAGDLAGSAESRISVSVTTTAALSLSPAAVSGGKEATLSGRIDGATNLDLIDRVIGLGGDRLTGRLSAKIALGGTVGKPELTGTAGIDDAFYEGVATGVVVRNARARLELAGERLKLVALSAGDGDGGALSGSGSFHLSDPGQAGLSLRFDKFFVIRRPEADVVVSGGLRISGGLAAPALSGTVTVNRAEIRIPERLPENVVVLDVIDANDLGSALSGPPGAGDVSVSRALKVALNVTVAVPGRTFVRGRGLDSEWRGRLVVAGDSAAPRITGTLKVVRGTFAFAGKRLKITEGSVSFPPGSPDQPEIAAVAETKLAQAVARITISGKASAPSLAISSEPAMPQEDILAGILFGKSTGQLSAIQAAQLAQTAAALSGAGGSAGLLDRVRSTLGVDVLDVEAGGDNARGASLKAGKYISDDVFLSVKQGTEPGSQRVGVEIEVLPNVTIESDVGAAADSNVGINWKWNY